MGSTFQPGIDPTNMPTAHPGIDPSNELTLRPSSDPILMPSDVQCHQHLYQHHLVHQQ